MTKTIERDGKKIIIVEKEIPLNGLDRDIQLRQSLLNNIDQNISGLQERRKKLITEIEELKVIKNSIEPPK